MASAQDFYNELKAANTRLDDIKGKLDALQAATNGVRAAIDHADQTLQWGFSQLITLAVFADQALAQNAAQNDTIICILEHISKNTCQLLDEAHTQTGLQRRIERSTSLLADLYAATHADAALARERLEALRRQIEACCPPPVPEPPCCYEPCPAPPPLGPPPEVDPRPPRK